MTWLEKRVISVLGVVMALLAVVLLVVLGLRYQASRSRQEKEEALAAIAHCDLLIVGGTSLMVHPAAGFIAYRRPNAKLVLINQTETPYDDQAQLVIRQNIARVLDEAVEKKVQ